ncbi:MAG: alpha/beta fold hydrolase [Gaiellaceae bacterium]
MTDAKPIAGLEERRADVGGASLRYFVGGEGPPLVLVHGLAGAASNWVELAPLLLPRHRLLIPELPGHGGSEALAEAPTLDPYADCVVELARLEGMGPSAFVGHSLGGTVALHAARRHPGDVTALVLLAAAGISSARKSLEGTFILAMLGWPGRAVAPFRTLIAAAPWARWIVFGRWEVDDPPALSAAAVEGFLAGPGLHTDVRQAAHALVAEDERFGLDAVHSPCLCVWGSNDRIVPLPDGFDYARRLGAPLRVIAGCGHLLIGERPAACADAIESFLTSGGAG